MFLADICERKKERKRTLLHNSTI